jgi:EAL domain-containing protein (putative c-di-GMP-specific phosphodiesterase class I)
VARQVCVEVTHAALHRQVSGSGGPNAVARLRELGCKIAMNGYLTEGMSISLLNAVDIVKLGAEVCSGVANRTSDVGLLKAAIEFAHRAGVMVVAECIENERDAAVLAEAGVDYLQGYLYGGAAPEHFNLTLAPIDADRVNYSEAQPERIAIALAAAADNTAQPESPEGLSAGPAIAAATAPAAIEEDAIAPVSAALLYSPETDLLKAALGKLESIQSF